MVSSSIRCLVPALALVLTGCAGDPGPASYAFVVQNKFAMDNCSQVLTKIERTSKRIEELRDLVERAEREAPGAMVAAAVYGPEIVSARGELRMLQQARIDKRCDEAPIAAPPREPVRAAPIPR